MKTATLVTRVLLGLIYAGFASAFFLGMLPQQVPAGAAGQFTLGLAASGYIMYVVKATELICGLAFLSGRFVPLASVIVFPVTLNIFMFHAFLEPAGLPMGIIMLAANAFLFYQYRERYNGILSWK